MIKNLKKIILNCITKDINNSNTIYMVVIQKKQ
jgi:hypothetical protein